MLIGNLQLWYLSVQGCLISFRETQGGAQQLVGCRTLWDQEVGGRDGRREVREVRSLEKWGDILRGCGSGVISQGLRYWG